MEEIDMRLIIILTVIIYWLLPVDIAPGPLDDIIVTIAGVIMAAAEVIVDAVPLRGWGNGR